MSAAVTSVSRGLPTVSRAIWAILLVLVVGTLAVAFYGQYTLPHDNDASLFHRFNDMREWIDANRNTNIILVIFVSGIRGGIRILFDFLAFILHALTWPGLTAIGAVAGLAVGGWRMAALMATGFLSFGVLGLWERSVDTLALTLAAVLISLAIGIPLGILAGRSDRFMNAIRPVLDVMQIMPTFAYLAPFALFFLIGPATAAIVTMIYAMPPTIRITALGIRGVAPASVEAATSLGSTRRQILTKVQLPMARRTIILGINQTIMMALSMVVITALVDAPGLGKNIIHALQQSDVGLAFDAGLAVVIMAIMLDRLTTQASERLDPAKAQPVVPFATRPWFRYALVAVPIAAVGLGTALVGGADFPSELNFTFRSPINAAVHWVATTFFGLTEWIKNGATFNLINPIEGFLTHSPWWLMMILIVGVALLVSGRRQALLTAVCLALIMRLQMWEHSMATLAQVLIATALTLGIGLLLGILSARSDRFAQVLRPILDAAQTMPAFVYLIPALALFGPTRFTAIVAALIYSVPPVIRLVEIGIRTVPVTVREAAIAAGSTPAQLLWKVELPLARSALLVAANQGIILVLAMVVVGGLVGAGALGYDVVAGFARQDFFGEGLAAGIAIVLLGVMLDRITQGAARQRRNDLAVAVPKGAA